MTQAIMTRIFKRNKGQNRRLLSVAVTMLLALALMTSVAFADTDGDPSGKDDAMRSEVSSATRADANPSMDIARWYAPAAGSVANTSWAIRADANPSMDIARWYAPAAGSATNTSWAIQPGANPSMDVALWYAPVEVGARDLLCAAEDLSAPCP